MRRSCLRLALLSSFLLLRSAQAVAGADTLNGTTLTCCYVPGNRLLYRDTTTGKAKLKGLAIDYLRSLEESADFRCANASLLTSVNESWNGMVDKFARCSRGQLPPSHPVCRCDLGVGSWIATRDRFPRVELLPSFSTAQLHVLTHVANTDSSVRGPYFLQTFSPTVWICIAALGAVFTALRLLDQSYLPPDATYAPLDRSRPLHHRSWHYVTKSNIVPRLRDAARETVARMVGGHADNDIHINSMRTWWINLVIVLCTFFIMTTYGSIMTASLVQENINSTYRTIEDLRTCRVKPTEVCLMKNSIARKIWDHAIAIDECHKDSYPRITKNGKETIKLILQKKCKFSFFGSGAALYYSAEQYCGTIFVTGKPVFWSGTSFILRKGSNYTQLFSEKTFELRETGQLKTVEEFYKLRGTCHQGDLKQLTFRKMRLFFILAFSACGVLFVLMLVFPQRVRGRSKPENQSDTDTIENEETPR